uniref:NADH dehydrogenase subunit 2 n=1 Tax=Alboglossiphonia lata TaxID=321034 RepID=UPI0023D84735|nr:NADH dehydrogenase subunit 2 [Alboglossiphonia lata]WDA96097.1 NADH dehydrogenase subunit 2 [Alboglossiphonia lata]
MLSSPTMILALFMMFLGTLMALSASNWFYIWIALEINMLSFIPVLSSSDNVSNCEAASKYLLIQAIASAIMLLSSYFMMINKQEFMYVLNSMLMFALMMKLGMFPANFWFPPIMQACNWMGSMLLATWQKIAPAFLLIYNIINQENMKIIMLFMALMNTALGGIIGYNQSNIKAILAYSSISHMGWFMIPLIYNMPIMSMYYFFMYLVMSLPVFFIMLYNSSLSPSNSSNIMMLPDSLKISLMMMLLSLAGLPPLSGFCPKLMIIKFLLITSPLLAVIMVMLTCFSLYFYLMLAYNLFWPFSKLMKFNKMNIYYLLVIITSFMYTPFLFIIYALILFNKS